MKIPEKINLAKVGIFAFRASVALLLFLAITKGCEDNPPSNDLKDNPQIQKNDSTIKAQDKIIERLKSDSIKAKDQLDLSFFKAHQIELSKKDLSKKYNSLRAKVKDFENGEHADFYVNRYKLPNDVKTTQTGTDLSDTVAEMNITELYDLDECREKAITDSLLIIQKNKSIFSLTELNSICQEKSNAFEIKAKTWEDSFNIASDELTKEKEANSKEPIFTMYLGGGGGIDKGLSQFAYKFNLGFMTRNRNLYFGSFQRIGLTDFVLAEVNMPIFTIKGKKKTKN